jgi:ribosomal protein S18 acetylase RimI-like enzyme
METCAYCNAKSLFRDHVSGAYLCPEHAWLEVTGPRMGAPRPPLTIRPATTDDHSQIAALVEYFRDSVEIVCCGHVDQVDALQAYVACDEDKIVGAACYTRAGDALTLVALNVLPKWQGRGVATDLITAAIQEARAQGAARVIAAVSNDDLPGLGLYQRLGFVIVGVLVGRLARPRGDVERGFDGILVRDEIQLELRLDE